MSSRTSPRPNRKPIKTEVVTESHLNYLQKEIDKHKTQISSIQKKIDQFLSKKQNDEALKQEDEEKLRYADFIQNILNKYRKEIGMTSDFTQQSTSRTTSPIKKSVNSSSADQENSPKKNDSFQNVTNSHVLLDFTCNKFDKKQAEIDDLSEQIRKLQEKLENLQSQALKAKTTIDNLNLIIPNLKVDLSNLTYDETIDQSLLNKKLFKSINNIDFYKDDISQRKSMIKQLKNDIRNLTPPEVTLKKVRNPCNSISIHPTNDMVKAKSYEDRLIKSGMKKVRPVLINARDNRVLNVSASMKDIKPPLASISKSINRIKKKTEKETVIYHILQPADTFNLVQGKAKLIVELKNSLKKNKEDLKNIKESIIPELMTASPEGLAKWRSDLLKQINIESSKYDKDIDSAKRQYKDAKQIFERKIASLKKEVEAKKGSK